MSESIKDQLVAKLAELTISKTESNIIINNAKGDSFELKLDYDVKKYGFAPGDLICKSNCTGCDAATSTVGLVVGVGKGCPSYPDQNELWILWIGRMGISHFCGAKGADFAENGIILVR